MLMWADVSATMKALNPETTDEEVTRVYEEMLSRRSEIETQLEFDARAAFRKKFGHPMDGLSFLELAPQIKMAAEDQVRGIYLEPLTQQIVQNQLEEDEEGEDNYHLAALREPDGWKTRPWDITVSPQAQDAMMELWSEEETTFRMLASTLMEYRMFHDLPIPYQAEGPLFLEMQAQIQEAVDERAKRKKS